MSVRWFGTGCGTDSPELPSRRGRLWPCDIYQASSVWLRSAKGIRSFVAYNRTDRNDEQVVLKANCPGQAYSYSICISTRKSFIDGGNNLPAYWPTLRSATGMLMPPSRHQIYIGGAAKNWFFVFSCTNCCTVSLPLPGLLFIYWHSSSVYKACIYTSKKEVMVTLKIKSIELYHKIITARKDKTSK